jgi:hypothetical protein
VRVRYRHLGSLLGLLWFASCSPSANGVPVRASTVPSLASGGSSAALPGEPAWKTSERLLFACMDGFGDTNWEEIEVVADGVPSKSRAYRDNNPDTNKHYDECQKKALAAVPIAPQSKDDLRATHGRLTKIVDCVRDAGFDLGTMVSVDEFVANGGVPEGALTSRWSQFAEQPEFLENFNRCGKLFPAPPEKS